MKPGEVFGVGRGWTVSPDAFVVIDDHNEIGFWTGRKACWGDVAPGMSFEVLS